MYLAINNPRKAASDHKAVEIWQITWTLRWVIYLILIVEVKLQLSWISHTQKPLTTSNKLMATISPKAYVLLSIISTLENC